MSDPEVTVIMPVRNEARFVAAALSGILATRATTLEVLVVDGGSTDGTGEVVRTLAATDTRIRLIDNPARIVPTALNIGIRAARGRVIVRLDAHAEVDAEYIPTLVRYLKETDAVNVGGVWETLPGATTAEAEAIALVLSSPLGVGGASYRTGATEPTWVDTVPFGCWTRQTLEQLGGFDEVMIRNQDDELNGRILARGGRILLIPAVRIKYYARSTVRALARMYYQYGWYKPLALRKVGRAVTVRQFVPAALVMGSVAGALWGATAPAGLRWLGALPVVAYGIFVVAATIRIGRGRSWRVRSWIPVVLAGAHYANGVGFCRGVIDFLLLHRDRWARTTDLPISR